MRYVGDRACAIPPSIWWISVSSSLRVDHWPKVSYSCVGWNVELERHCADAVAIVAEVVQASRGHRVVFRELLWIHHSQQNWQSLLHVLGDGVVVNRSGHRGNQAVKRERRQRVCHSVIHAESSGC